MLQAPVCLIFENKSKNRSGAQLKYTMSGRYTRCMNTSMVHLINHIDCPLCSLRPRRHYYAKGRIRTCPTSVRGKKHLPDGLSAVLCSWGTATQKYRAKMVHLIVLLFNGTSTWCLCLFDAWFKMDCSNIVESNMRSLNHWTTAFPFYNGSLAQEMTPLSECKTDIIYGAPNS